MTVAAPRFILSRPLLLARAGLLTGFSILFIHSALCLVYISVMVYVRGDVASVWDLFNTLQSLVLGLDVVAFALLAVGFFEFGRRHDYLGPSLQNLAVGFGLLAMVTLTWRLTALGMPFEDLNAVNRLAIGDGDFGRFVPQFNVLRENFVGFLLTSTLVFLVLNMLVGSIRNYRAIENFPDVNLGLFRFYGLLYLVGALLMGLGWMAFSPDVTAGWQGDALLGVYVVSWVVLYIIVPILGVTVFWYSFIIHRAAVETLSFIQRRKAEKEEASTSPRVGQSLGTTSKRRV